MFRWHFMRLWLGLLVLALFVGCEKGGSTPADRGIASGPTNTVAPARPTFHLDHAQPKLRTMKLWLGTNGITAEVALSRVEIATGMMFRESMAEDEGMLFVFGAPQQTGFYMKNTRVPLSVAYIDPDGSILEIHDLQPFNEEPVYANSSNVLYVLEMPQGWFKRHQIAEGAAVASERGTLRDVFFPNR